MHKGGTGETAQRDLVKHRLNDALWRFRMLSTNELGSATEFDDPNKNFSQ